MTPEQRGLMTTARMTGDKLLTPAWGLLAAPLRSREIVDGPPQTQYTVRLFDDDLRLAFIMTGHERPEIRLVASVRPSGALGKLFSSIARPADGGWKAVAATTLTAGDTGAVEQALREIYDQLRRIPAVRQKMSEQHAHLPLSDLGSWGDIDR